MVHDLELRAVVGVLVRERVEAVRARRDHLRDLGLGKRRRVCLRERLEEVLVPHAPGWVAGAALSAAEHRPVDARGVEPPRPALGRLLGALVERTGAANPEEVSGLWVARLEHADRDL